MGRCDMGGMSDDYDCIGTSSQQHCGSGGVVACNGQGQSKDSESTSSVLVIEEVMLKVKI